MADEDKQSSSDKKPPRPVRVPRKVPEPPGNLRKRADWFRKRSGS